MIETTDLGLGVNAVLFLVAAALVWGAGTRLAAYANNLSRATGIDQALMGLVLLAGVTSLPEIAVTVTSAAADDARLAINNLLGSIAMQVTVLALVDFYLGRKALTAILPDPNILLLGLFNILLLAVAAGGILAQDVPFAGAGIWAWTCLLAYLFSIWLLHKAEPRRAWRATSRGGDAIGQSKSQAAEPEEKRKDTDPKRLGLLIAIAGAVVLVGGYTLSRTGGAIAELTGIGSGLIGFVLLAISTSLPELSSALGAVRLGALSMAAADILGTNMINVGLIFLVDAVAGGEPILNRVGSFAAFGALLSIAVTVIFLMGLVERRDRTVGRLGVDSLALLAVYVIGVAVLFTLREPS